MSPHKVSENTSESTILNKSINNNKISVSLSLKQTSQVELRLMTVNGRIVLLKEKQISGNGVQTVEFSMESLASGTYCYSIIAGKQKTQSILYVE